METQKSPPDSIVLRLHKSEGVMFPAIFLMTLALSSQADKSQYPPLGTYSHNFVISEFYDSIKDESSLMLEFGNVWSDANPSLSLRLAVVQWFKGKSRANPIGGPRLIFETPH